MTSPDVQAAPAPPPRGVSRPRRVRLGDLRAAIGPACRRRSRGRALGGLARDAALYAAAVTGALVVDAPPLRLLLGLAAGVAVAALFVWAHDAAHGALFARDRTAEVLGTLAMLPSLQMYRLWQLGHNRVHHGFTGLVTIDWIWRPWSPAEYRRASGPARLGYRVERSAAGCGWHYLRRVWWDGMVRFRGTNPRQRRDAHLGRVLALAWVALAGAGAWAAGGWWAVLAAVVVPWLVFTWLIAGVVYLHHTHPSRRFVDDRADWDPVRGQVTGSIVIHTPRPLASLLHHIMIHTPHHLDSRIPYYHLPAAWRDLRPVAGEMGLDVLEYRLSWRAVRGAFGACKLYDYRTGRWSGFAGAAAPAAGAPAAA
jgi:omega-6 fatty acid desaturase (delta-12 desaturase)